MKNRSLSFIMLLTCIFGLVSCDEDSIFYPKVITKNGITTVSGIRPGGLERAIPVGRLTITHLVIEDTIDSRDFQTMRDEMPNLKIIDLSKAVIAAYNGFDGTAGRNEYYYPANVIPQYAFYNSSTSVANTSLNTVVFPGSLKSIGNYAFNRCSGLTGTLVIPASVTDTIGRSAFAFCDHLSGVTLSGSKYIGESAFQGCPALTGALIFPEGVETISRWAFAYCPNVSSVSLSATVANIGNSAFNGSGGAFTVADANSNYSAADGVLFNADKSVLIRVPSDKTGTYEVPASVGDIGTYSFANCTSLTSVIMPSALNTIEDYAFSGCSGLAGDFPIPAGLFNLGMNVFDDCPLITGFNIDAANTVYSYADGLLIDLQQSMVKRCVPSTTSCVIPSTVFMIEGSAFSGCESLTSVTIPENIIYIGQRAFGNCTSLISIYMLSATPIDMSFGPTAFDGVDKTQSTLYVPSGAYNAYKKAAVWKDFLNIVEN